MLHRVWVGRVRARRVWVRLRVDVVVRAWGLVVVRREGVGGVGVRWTMAWVMGLVELVLWIRI